ncbi:DUF397 domain-containing protein [Phytomonospora sp. NPDC050363]
MHRSGPPRQRHRHRPRDTKDRTGPVFTFTPDTWTGFVAGLKSGEFDG